MVLLAIAALLAAGVLVQVLVARSTLDRILGESALEQALSESDPAGPLVRTARVPKPRVPEPRQQMPSPVGPSPLPGQYT